MAGTTSKRSRAASIQKQAIDQVNLSLQELPEKPKDNLSLREAVNQLQDEIRGALAKGYSYDDLAAMFSEKGIDISALTLKRYVSSGRSRAGKTKTAATRTRRKTKDSSPSASDAQSSADETATPTKSSSRRSGTAAAKARATKATATESKKTTGRTSSRASKAGSSTTAKPASTRSRKRTAK